MHKCPDCGLACSCGIESPHWEGTPDECVHDCDASDRMKLLDDFEDELDELDSPPSGVAPQESKE
jgi:Fe-S-cluster containining protein